jgi:hypothetical protein
MGAEALLGPVAMWAVIGLLAAGILVFIYKMMVSGAVAKDDLKEAGEAEKERKGAGKKLDAATAAMRGAWRRVRNGTGD